MIPQIQVVEDIIGSIDPDDLPFEFIGMARIIDLSGSEKLLSGKALTQFLNNPHHVAEVSIMVDIELIRKTITDMITHVFAEVDRKVRVS